MAVFRKMIVNLTKTTSFSMLAALMLFSVAVAPSAFAGSDGLVIEADAVEGATEIGITGQARSSINPVIIQVFAPNGNLVTVDQVKADSDGNFATTIGVGGPLWKQDGIYTIKASQGSNTIDNASVEVDVADGHVVPEFGTIASLVLVAAISSIIVLSAKGRLSFTPRI